MRFGVVMFLMLAVAVFFLVLTVPSLNGAGITPNQDDTEVTYTITIKGADKTSLSVDGGRGIDFSKTTSVTLDGSKSHQFQVSREICQSGWECGDAVSNWKNGIRLEASQWSWTVPAGKVETHTGYESELVCVSYDSHTGSCVSYSYIQVPYTYETFTPPCSPCAHTFEYTSQYRLVLEDKYSSSGSRSYGWFDSCASVQLPSLDHPDTIEGAPGVRNAFDGWAIDESGSTANEVTMCAPHLATATYITQYRVEVTSQCPDLEAKGSGWYNEGSTGTLEVTGVVPMRGWLGSLGGKDVFTGWLGNPSITTTIAQVVVNQPMTITATCRADYTVPGGILVTITMIGGGCGTYIHHTKKKKKPPRIIRDSWGGDPLGKGVRGPFFREHQPGTFGSGPPSYGQPIGGPSYSQPSTPPSMAGEPPSPITPGGQPIGGPGIGQGQANPPTQLGQPAQPGPGGTLTQPTGQGPPNIGGPQPVPPGGTPPAGTPQGPTGQPGQPGIQPAPGGQPAGPGQAIGSGQPVQPGQPIQPTQPTIQPGGQTTPSIKPGGQAAPKIGPGQPLGIGPGQQPSTPSSPPPTTIIPAPLTPTRDWEFCAHCGERIPLKSKYCPLCGLRQD